MPWARIVFGWPFVVLGAAAFAAAFTSRHRWLGFLGAALAAPFCFFVSLYPLPLLRWGGDVALAANCVAAWLLQRRRQEIAFAFLLPWVILSAVLAMLVYRQP